MIFLPRPQDTMFTRRQSKRGNTKKKSSDVPLIESVDDRKRRKSNAGVNIVCPVCTVTVRGDQKFHQHYIQEIDKVKDPFTGMEAKRKHYQTRLQNRKKYSENDVEDNDSDECKEEVKLLEERTKDLDTIRKERYERYAKMFLLSMKRNNVNRSNGSRLNNNNNNNSYQAGNSSTVVNNNNSSNENSSSHYELVTCAVCNEFLETSNCSKHLSKCFAKHDYQFELFSSSEEEDNDEDNESPGGDWMDNAYFRREGNLTRLVMEDDADDVELDIDGDNEDTEFGRQQYLFFTIWNLFNLQLILSQYDFCLECIIFITFLFV